MSSPANSPVPMIVGTWRLISHKQELAQTGEVQYPRGENPQGLITYTNEGRFHVLNVPGDRTRPKGESPTELESLQLFRGLTAYAGRYTVASDVVTHHVEVSWNEAWSGTEQLRRFAIEGDTLTIIAGPAPSPWDGKRVTATLTWRRVRPT